MNKIFKTAIVALMCFGVVGPALAAPHGGHRPGPAHHQAPPPQRHHRPAPPPPPPPPPRHHHHHHHGHTLHTEDWVGVGALITGAVIGGIIGATR